MTTHPVSNLNALWLQEINNNNRTAGTGATTTGTTNDTPQISPFAQLMNTLQQLQQSNPTQYKQVTGTLASDLQTAATDAQNHGNTTEANALNQLAASFNQASQTGQLPSFMQNGAQHAGTSGHHHHHHHGSGGELGEDLNSISQTILSTLDPTATNTSARSNPQQQL